MGERRTPDSPHDGGLQRAPLDPLLEHMPAAITSLRVPDFVVEFANELARQMLPTRGRLEGRTLAELAPDMPSDVRRLLDHVVSTGQRFSAPELAVTLDWDANGAPYDRFFNVLYEPIPGANGRVERVMSVAYDVTSLVKARRQAEELSVRLRESEARTRRLQDSGVIGVVFWTREGRLVDANDAFLSMVGYTREEVRAGDVRWTAMTPPEFAHLDNAAFVEMEQRGYCTAYEKEYIAKDGRRIPIELGVAFWEGRTDSGVAWIKDISERKKAERDRELALAAERSFRQQAEEASRAKEMFLSTLSHELRTPLNAILGWANVLRAGRLAPDQFANAVDIIERNARAQSRLIDDMLDLSSIVQGKLVLSVGPLEMVRVVRAAIETTRPAADAKDIRVHAVLDSHATIVGDAERLQQVVWNLLANAIKFTPKGGRVQVELRRVRSYVELTVSDNGPGIDSEVLPFIFERFRQGDGTIRRKYGGLGLGLAIVRSLVELHGGTVSAHSDGVGKGALFVVRLPIAPVRADSQGHRPEEGDRPGMVFEAPPALAGKRVLVLDDEGDTRALLTFLLRSCDCHVTTAANADEARAALASGVFDVVLSDVGLPGEDGYSFIQSVRRRPPDQHGRVPALALTAYARPEDRTYALKCGFNAHLAKPIDPAELVVVVAHLVGAYQS